MDASSGGSDQLPPSANDGEQQVMRQENGGNERRNAATTASSGTGNSNPSAVSSESSARGPSPAAPSTTNAAIPTGDLLPPPLPFPLPLPPAAALGGLFRDLPAPTQFFTPPPPIQIIGGAGGDGALPDRSVVGNEASSSPPNAAASSSAPQISNGQTRAQEAPLPSDSPAQLENRQDTIRRLLQTAIERTSPNPAMQVGAGANNDGTAAAPPPDVQYFAIFPQPNGQSLIFMPNVHHGIGGAGSPAANEGNASAQDGASRASAPEAQQPANAGAADPSAASQAGPSQQTPNDSTAPTPEMRARQRAVRDINAPSRAAMGPAARPRSPGWNASIPSAEQRASRLPRPASTEPAQTPAGDNAGVEPPGPGFTFHFDLGNFMHMAPPNANAPGTPATGTAPSPTPQAPAGAPSGIPLGAPIMTDVVFFGPGAAPHMMPLGPAVAGSGPNGQQVPGAHARGPIPAGGVPMPRPVSLEMLMQLMGGWGGRQHLAPDPERARELLQGLKDPGLDLLMRLDRVLCAENGGSANGLEGEGWKCAICMEGRDDADAKPAGGEALSSPMERSSTAGSTEDVEMSDVERMLSGESSRPASFKGTGLKAFPCHHIFHETCIEPWLQSKTTCPTCRFDIDPLSTTLRLPASMQRTNPLRPAPVRPATGDARQTPYGARPMTPQGAAAHREQQGTAAAAAGLNVQHFGRRFGMFGPSIRYTAPRHAVRDPERSLPPGYVPAEEPQQERPPTPAGPSWPPPPATYGEDGFPMPEARREASWRRSDRPLYPPGGAAYLNDLAEGSPAVDPAPEWRHMAINTTAAGNEASQTSASSEQVPRAAPAAVPQTTAAELNIPAGGNDGAPSIQLSPGQRGRPSQLPEAAAATDAPTTAPPNNAPNAPPGSAPQPGAPPAPQPAAGQGPLQSLTFTFEGGMMPPAFANAIFTSIMNGGAPVPVQGLVPGGGNPADNNNAAGGGGGPSPAAAAASPAAANPNASGQPPASGPAPPSNPPPRVRGPKPWIIPPHKETLQEWVAGREKALRWRCDDPVCVFAPPEHFHEADGDGDAGEPDGEWQTWQPPAAEGSGLVAIRAMEELHPRSSSDGDADAAASAEQSARQRRCPHAYHPQCLKISCLSSNWWLEDPDAHGEKIWLRCPRCRKQGWVTAEDMRSQAAEPADAGASRPIAQIEDDAMAA